MQEIKVYIVGSAKHYADFMKNIKLTDDIGEANVVLFTGGEDVTPSLYGCKKHPRTSCNPKRDDEERKIFDSIRSDQLVVGVCRGSQLMCVLNGGLLVQDCCNHALWTTHEIVNSTYCYQITSTHHQMQYPYNLPKKDYDLLYWSPVRSNYWEGEKIDSNEIITNGEPEIVLYHKQGKPRCLAIQGHPEMIPDSPVSEMLDKLIKDYVNGKK